MLIRLIPGIPFFAQNLILAGLGAERLKFFFTTLFGLIPMGNHICKFRTGD